MKTLTTEWLPHLFPGLRVYCMAAYTGEQKWSDYKVKRPRSTSVIPKAKGGWFGGFK